jgi:hypothetical protein
MTAAGQAPRTLSISLVSHTNVGKTTLARTLLGRDVGEVRDEAHVTLSADAHPLVESAAGDRLLLWDTPGFGDSLRLARRLAAAGKPLGWLMTEVWDRWRDPAFWASQHAIRHVLDQADVALYLVNAAEVPEDAAYLAPELQLLALLGKPVIVLLNQLGTPGTAADEARQVQRWQAHLAGLAGLPGLAGPAGAASAAGEVVAAPVRLPAVCAVLPLDAFARCWVQEAVLLQAVAQALPDDAQPAMARLMAAWRTRQQATWQAAMVLLAERLARAALDRQRLLAGGWLQPLRKPLRQLGGWLGWRGAAASSPEAQAMAALAARLDADIRRSTEALIRLHKLQGRATGEVLAQLAQHFARREPVSEGKAALWGGVVTGALAGLKADLVSGGLTLGGGLLAGGVLGALGAAGAVRGVNRIRGLNAALLAWDDAVLAALLRSALLGYLAVAHHGRGRGDWRQDEAPPAWIAAVDTALLVQAPALARLWQQRQRLLAQAPATDPPRLDDEGRSQPPPSDAALTAPPDFAAALQTLLTDSSAAVLLQLYPEAAALAGLGRA